MSTDERTPKLRDVLDSYELITPVNDFLWHEPRLDADKLVPEAPLVNFDADQDFDYGSYNFGMEQNSHAFICGLIKKYRPRKILEVGVNQGGTSVVVLQALASLNLKSELHSVDINPTLPASKNVPNWAPHLIDRWHLYYGKDVSAFLEEIGDSIDFCIMDTAHFMPGEVLNFLCIFPYLHKNAIVVIDDQMTHLNENNEFVKIVGAAWTIACRILFDTVVAEKLVPAIIDSDADTRKLLNVSSFKLNRDTQKHIGNLFSCLLLPWRFLPTRHTLVNIHHSLKINYPDHFLTYFVQIVEEQLRFHQSISNVDDRAKTYWTSLMIEQVGSSKETFVAFYGAGLYCRTILNDWLPRKYHPKMLFDTDASGKGMLSGIKILSRDELKRKYKSLNSVIITSPEHKQSIHSLLQEIQEECQTEFKIINPFNFPLNI